MLSPVAFRRPTVNDTIPPISNDEVAQRLERALLEAVDHLAAQSGTIHLKLPGQKVLRLGASHGIPPAVQAIVEIVPWGKGMAGLAAECAQPVDACNIQTNTSGDVRPGARATGVAGAIVVPVMLGADVVGTLGVGCVLERTFDADETAWLLQHGRALALDLARAHVAF
jgi:L-methionine (R)-S-oxide reductase